ncbi:serine aminopeptidase domain-containing protein [Hoeflea sp.]|uniref:serine aminopeptidase domain-containing protein n=1 Tax=Hoeflea sp. TaxID=1940281 RepID=UPI003BB09F0C
MECRYLPRPGGATLYFRKWSSRPGLPPSRTARSVFLGHSQPTHSGMFDDIARSFSNAGWQAHSGDIRGHGNSTGKDHALGHLNESNGWQEAIEDMRHFLETSFEGVAWEDRLVVAPNISALLTLEVLKTWPDLAQHIVLISPVPNQRTLALVGKTFMQVRLRLRAPDERDEQALHHLYTFLGSHLKDRQHLADVMTSDRAIIRKVIDDPLAWPTPTVSYWANIFSGMLSAWRWPRGARVAAGTRFLIMFGGEDAMLRDGGFLPPIERFLQGIGVDDIASDRVEGARSALFLEETKLNISGRILDWIEQRSRPRADHQELDVEQIASEMLSRFDDFHQARMSPDELVELCYNAIDDESRWAEIIYRMIYEAERSDADSEEELQSRISRLMPHWERAFNINRQVMMNATLGVLLQGVIERLQIGVAILDKEGELLHANSTYSEAVARLLPQAFQTSGNDVGAARATRLLLSESQPDANGVAMAEQVILHEGKPVGFHFHPDALKQTGLQRQGPSGILVLRATDDDETAGDTRRILTELAYGLTGKEAEITLMVAQGKSLETIAEDMGILLSTVRGHLKKSFHKLGVHSQAEMVARIMSGPLGWLK